MKKNKRHLYKRLPKYALGTMKPIDLGYQPGRGIGSARFETEQNMSLEPETQAIRKSALPNAIGYIGQQTPYVTEMLKSSTNAATNTTANTIANTANTVTNTANTMANFQTGTQSFTPTILQPGAGVQMTNRMTGGFGYHLGRETINALTSSASAGAGATLGSVGSNATSTVGRNFAQNLFEHGAGKLGGQAVKEGVTKAGSSALGTALGAVGTAIGGYTMANQIAGFGDHRSAQDMLANVGRSHVTTDYGNQYTTYNGVNAGQELAYEKANARSKQLGFGMNAIGTGASLGGLLASAGALGSIGGPLGTALGAGVGLLVGGLGSLFGWGDNSEEIERLTRLTNDNIANYNRQGEAVARSKDVAAEFNDRQGVAAAEGGKSSYGPMKILSKYTPGKNNFNVNPDGTISYGPTGSKIQGQEVTGNPSGDAAIAPGDPKKGDVVNSSITPYDDNFVISNRNPYIKYARNIVKDQNRLDYIIANAGGSKEQQQLQIKEAEKMKRINTNKLMEIVKYNPAVVNPNAYKNGKLPGYWRGTDYLMSAIPHIAALGSSWNQYNRAKYADMPDYPNIVDSSANTQAINILGRRRFDPAPLLEHIHRTHRNNLYDINRTPGLTAGGQAIARANNTISEAQRGAEVLAQADETKNKYTEDYANALANYGKMMTELMTNNNYARAAFRQQQNAAKEGWMAQYEKNGLTALADLASDIMVVRQFNRSEDYGDKMLELYNQQVENDKVKVQAELANAMKARLDREAAYNKAAKEAVEKTHPMFLNWGAFAPNNINNLYGMLNSSLTAPSVKQYSWMR